ncbi:MAG: hypothetical protein ACK5MU_04830 [Candidatus Saccharimonadales bacterium]
MFKKINQHARAIRVLSLALATLFLAGAIVPTQNIFAASYNLIYQDASGNTIEAKKFPRDRSCR